MKFLDAKFSIKGQHDVNQDSLLTPIAVSEAMVLFGIADGVGGSDRGEVASSAVLAAARAKFEGDPSCSVAALFEAAKEQVDELYANEPGLGSLSTTLTLCSLNLADKTVRCGHVGDCRLYHLSGEGLITRTRDQTEAQRLVDEGILRPQQVRRYARRNVLTSSISSSRDYELYTVDFPVSGGDRLILCSDGLHTIVKKRELVAESLSSDNLKKLAYSIENLALQRVPSDDCTALFVEVADSE